MSAPRLLTRAQTCEVLGGVSARTLDRLERQGVIPARKRLGAGTVRWLSTELEASLEKLPTGPLRSRTADARKWRHSS